VQGTCVFGTGCRGARLLVSLILNDRVQPSFIAGVVNMGADWCLDDLGHRHAPARRHRRTRRHRSPSRQHGASSAGTAARHPTATIVPLPVRHIMPRYRVLCVSQGEATGKRSLAHRQRVAALGHQCAQGVPGTAFHVDLRNVSFRLRNVSLD
jgi:hypothetical protein